MMPEDGDSTPRSEVVPPVEVPLSLVAETGLELSTANKRQEVSESGYFSPRPIRHFSTYLATSSGVSAEASPTSSHNASSVSLDIPPSHSILDTERLHMSLADLSERPSLQQTLSDSSTTTNSTVRPNRFDSLDGFPHYPNQAYSALQRQQHPLPYTPLIFRARSSHQAFAPSGLQGSSPFSYDLPESGSKTVGNTPSGSPVHSPTHSISSARHGLFGSQTPPPISGYDGTTDEHGYSSPYLHWTHTQIPKETEKAEVMREGVTGRKHINQYMVLDELGRGTHGKVKLARNMQTGEHVAIKIVERVSKKRRLGKDPSHEDKIKREVAILKKARHPHIVSLLEVIDDPASAKVYIVLEHVELGEVKWEAEALDEVAVLEYRRYQRDKHGLPTNAEAEREDHEIFEKVRRRRLRRERRERPSFDRTSRDETSNSLFSLEYGGDSDEENDENSDQDGSESVTSYTTNGGQSEPHNVPLFAHEMTGTHNGPLATAVLVRDITQNSNHGDENGARQSHSNTSLATIPESPFLEAANALEGTMYGAYEGEFVGLHLPNPPSLGAPVRLARKIEDVWRPFKHVPLMTLKDARSSFRETLLGLEYLHYQGVIHRDIKPANLLQTRDHHIKISDFGVSYLGKETSGEGDQSESEHEQHDDPVELAKTVGTPEFYAPELCNPEQIPEQVDGQIDVWALGVTLHCLIYGRLPYDHPDAFAVMTKIWEDDAFLLRRRLKPVDIRAPSRPSSRGRYFSPAHNERRAPDELSYEEVDDELYDLLRRLLIKDPKRRIKLLEVKHHPWVLRDLADPKRWLDETDPGRQMKGKKIEISKEDVADAVVPLTIVERARSVLRKGIAGVTSMFGGKVSRRRAQSNATNEDTTPSIASSTSSLSRESRRPSIRPEDMITALKASREPEHPLSQSQTASPEAKEHSHYFLDHHHHHHHHHHHSGSPSSPTISYDGENHAPLHPSRPLLAERAQTSTSTNGSVRTLRQRDLSRGASGLASALQPGLPSTPLTLDPPAVAANLNGIFGGAGRTMMRRVRSNDRATSAHGRSLSIDAAGATMAAGGGSGLGSASSRTSTPASEQMMLTRAEPSLGLSTACANGNVEQPAELQLNLNLTDVESSRKSSVSVSESTDASRPQTATTRIDSEEFPSMETSPTSDDFDGYGAGSDGEEEEDDDSEDEGLVFGRRKRVL